MNKRKMLAFLFVVLLGYYGYTFWIVHNRNNAEQQMIHNIKQNSYIPDDDEEMDNYNNKLQLYGQENSVKYTEGNSSSQDTSCKTEGTEDNRVPQGFDCIVSIPDISLEKVVYTGNTREAHLQQYDLITAANDMYYRNGGNYIICGHYSQLYGHSLNRLKELNVGDSIYIISNSIQHEYEIYSVDFETMTDTGTFCRQTKQREITILSCAKYIASDKYIIIKGKLKN